MVSANITEYYRKQNLLQGSYGRLIIVLGHQTYEHVSIV